MRSHPALRLILAATIACALLGLPSLTPAARADGFIDFENGVDEAPIRSTIPGLQFTTTQGYDWIYGDWRTGVYSGPFPTRGKYYSNGNFFAWLGPNQGMGRIDFTEGGATYVQVWVSSASGLYAKAYNRDNQLIATSHVDGNLETGRLAQLRVEAPPNQKIAYAIFHDSGNQWLIDDLSTDAAGVPEQRPPVIVIPGIIGSQLDYYNHLTGNGGPVWPPLYNPSTRTVDASGMPDPAALLSGFMPMYLAADGSSPQLPIYKVYSAGLLKDLTMKLPDKEEKQSGYGPLVRRLEKAGHKVYEFHYDWRLDVRGALTGHGKDGATESLDSFINKALRETGAKKVNIVAHSLGGLVTRAYVSQSAEHAAKVEQAIILGTPYLGAPHALWGLRDGFKGMEGWMSSVPYLDVALQSLVQNYPSIYEIVPSQRYWDLADNWYFKDGQAQSYSQLQQLLAREHNGKLANVAKQLHGVVDYWGSIPGGTEFRFIVGSGRRDTPGQIIEKYRYPWQGGTQWDVLPTNGDGTVTVFSASMQNTKKELNYRGNVPIWYADGVGHQGLTEQPYVLDFIVALLATPPNAQALAQAEAQAAASPEISADDLLAPHAAPAPPPLQAATAPVPPPELRDRPFPLDGAQIAVFNAAELHVYDSAGRHTGPRSDGGVETQIPRSTYDRVGNGLYVTVPAGASYRTEIVPLTGRPFDVRIRDVEGLETDFIQRTLVYEAVNVETGGIGTVTVNPDNLDSATRLAVDANRDGHPERNVPPTGDLSPAGSYDFQPPQNSIGASGSRNSQGWYTGRVRISIEANDTATGVGGVRYSLDDGRTWQDYAGPFDVTAEATPSITADAWDRAGNHGYAHIRLIPALLMLPFVRTPDQAQPQPESWLPTSGAGGRTVFDLASADSACEAVYAATDAGIFRSLDGGLNWESRFAPAAGAATQRAPTYEAAGATPTAAGMGTAVAVCAANPNIVYAGSWGGGVYRSTDRGGSWQQRSSGLGDPWIYDLAVAGSACDVVYAATSGGGIYKTANGGAAWHAANSGLGNLLARSVTVAESNPNRVYAGTASGAYRSDNGGASWMPVGGQLPAATVWSLAVARSNADTVYAGVDGFGVYRSDTAGGAWASTGGMFSGAHVRALIVDPLAPATLYVGRDDGGGVYRSADGAASWQDFSAGLDSANVKALRLDGGSCRRLLAGSGNGIWRYGR